MLRSQYRHSEMEVKMAKREQADAELLSMFKEAHCICCELYELTLKNISKLPCSTDDDIIQFIYDREAIINKLVVIENNIYLILDNAEEYDGGHRLPPEVEAERVRTRQLIGAITELDQQVIEVVSSKVQLYKEKTLKTRNSKHISAYLKTSLAASGSSSNINIAK